MPEAKVRQFMSTQVLTVPPEVSLAEVATQMSEARVSCVVVCAGGDRPVGVVTERDLTRAYCRDVGRDRPMPVVSAMSQGVLTLAGSAGCDEAAEIMGARGVRRIVVVDEDGALAGILTRSDLLRAHAEAIEQQKQQLEDRVRQRTRELEALNARLESLSLVDPLLGIGNRRAMDDELASLEHRARRYARPFAVALVDVDHFKKYNDRYGHAAGDAALQRVARCIAEDIRAADAVYRYGGEEFLVVLPEVDADGAVVAARHVRDAVGSLALAHADSPFGRVTVSIGVAGDAAADPCWKAMVARADAALYAAKDNGRNRVERGRPPRAVAA